MSHPSSQAMASKARAMFGKHLKASDYQDLLHKTSVQDIAAYLKNSQTYHEILSGINEQTIHRGFLEMLIRQSFYKDFLSLTHYGDPNLKSFYQFGIISIETKQILITLRNLGEEDRSSQIAQLPLFANKQLHFDVQGLVSVKTFDELMVFLQKTPYASILKRYRPVRDEELDYTACETALKKYHYEMTMNLIKRYFTGEEQKELFELMQIRMELENLTIIYRLKKYYKSSVSKIKSILNPVFIHFSRKKLFTLIEQDTLDEFIEALGKSYYHITLENRDTVYFEHLMDRVLYKNSLRLLRFSKHPHVIFVAYLNLVEVQIQNIIDIIEGVRYKADQESIDKILIY